MLHTHRNFYTETLLHTEKLLHTASFYTQNLLHIASFFRKKFLNRETFLYIITAGIAAPKLDLDAKAKNRPFRSTFYKDFSRKITSAKIEKTSNICWQITFAALMQPLQYDLRDPAAQEISITHAAAVPSNLDAAVTMRFAASRCKPARIYARGNIRGRQSCSHANAICNHSFKKRIQLRTQEQPLVAKHIEGTNRVRNGPSRTRRTHEVPFIAACSHFTRKNARFRAPASSPKHGPCNIHAASPMRFATTASRNAKNYTHTGTTTRCNAHRRNQSRPERPQPHPPHTRGTFHRRLHPLYTEKYKVSCSGFLPQTWPMQHSCSQSNAICNHSFKKRIQLRTQEQPLVAKHIEGTNRVRNDPSRTRRTHEVPFIAACSHFTRKDARFRAPAPPNT